METKDVLQKLRESRGMTQAELAEKLFVTRQAVSRWENGETIPSTDTLKLLSKIFDVSINTLLGSPQQLKCQCCGMPLEDAILSHEPDGTINEEYLSGVTRTASSFINHLRSLSTFSLRVFQTISGQRTKQELTLRQSFRV
jgi:transcriptional regulator with XRE-family HTH domain